MTPHATNETLRKALHFGFGFLAFSLKLLPWWASAAIAAAAVLGNWLVLHRIVGTAVARHARGYDAGIVLYPAAVLTLILVFRNELHYAAIGWAMMAFGDGAATLVGRAIRIAPLPWNRDKSWGGLVGFLLAASAGGMALAWWMGAGTVQLVLVTALASAIAESLPLGVDDNVTVPFAAAVALVVAGIEVTQPFSVWPVTIAWLVVNAVLAIVGYLTHSVSDSGALGGWALGTIVILGAGWPLYVALLAFFVIGTTATKLGYARKAAAGLAQEGGGRRGFGHAFSNVGVAAICAVAVSRIARGPLAVNELELVPLFMGIASLATAAADTTASEIGQLIGRRAFLPLTLRRVPVGTEGAISVEGTLVGLVGGFAVSLIGLLAVDRLFERMELSLPILLALTACAFLGSYIESIAGSWNRRQERAIPNGVLNFFNTAVGALFFYGADRLFGLVEWQGLGRLF